MAIDRKTKFVFSIITFFIALLPFVGLFLYYLVVFDDLKRTLPRYEFFESLPNSAPSFPKLSPSYAMNLGWAHNVSNTPKTGYISRPKKKEPGIIRIGIFGDSLVHGSEAGYGLDFPSLLQKKFDENGMRHVEVINFGFGGYGMHQSYMLWNYLGKEYDLDYVIFNPYRFHIPRDTSFIFQQNYAPVHARYILNSKDKVELIPVVGKTRREAARTYYSHLQPWIYMRYDVKMPNFLKPFLPANRRGKCNPLYYENSCDFDEEALETYRRLFLDVIEHSRYVVFRVNDETIFDLVKQFNAFSNAFVFQSSEAQRLLGSNSASLYKAPMGHFSGLGNQYHADELFSLLTGLKRNLKYIEIVDKPVDVEYSQSMKLEPLFNYDQIAFKIKNSRFATLRKRKGPNPWNFGQKVRMTEEDVHGVLLYSVEGGDLRLLPLNKIYEGGQKVVLRLRVNGKDYEMELGMLQSLGGVFYKITSKCAPSSGSPLLSGDTWQLVCAHDRGGNVLTGLRWISRSALNIDNVRLLFGEDEIFSFSPMRESAASGKAWLRAHLSDEVYFDRKSYVYRLDADITRLFVLRTGGPEFLDPNDIEEDAGVVTLSLRKGDGRETEISVLGWRMRYEEMSDALPNTIPLISTSKKQSLGGQARRVQIPQLPGG